MATLEQWDKDAARMTDEELKERVHALEVLKNWPLFYEEFRWTGIFALIFTLLSEAKIRIARHVERIP